MKKLFILFSFAGLAALVSCTEHEVIPPPVPLVDLECSFEALINDSSVTYTDSCDYESAKTIVSGGVSRAQYKTTIEDVDLPGGIELEIRSINWIDDGSNNPTLDEFRSFFIDNPTPVFSGGIDHNGVVVRWTDLNGNVWVSDTTDGACVENFAFTLLVQESDATGDYMKFKSTFDCRLINSDYGVVDSVKCLVGAKLNSAFRLE